MCCCSVTQLCLTLCDPRGCNTPGFPVLDRLLELAQTYVHGVRNAIQPSCPQLPLLLTSVFSIISIFSNESVHHKVSVEASASVTLLLMNINFL